jgi:signal transduction histidine kinase
MNVEFILNQPVSILVVDSTLRIVRINECFSQDLKEFDMPGEKLIGCHIRDIIKNFSESFHRVPSQIYLCERSTECLISFREIQDTRLVYIERPPRIIEKRIKKLFIAELSKKIKVPLILIVKMINLLTSTKLHREQKEYIDIMRENSMDILKVTNDLLEYFNLTSGGKSQTVSPIPIEFTEISGHVHDIVKTRMQKKSINLQFFQNNQILYTDYQKLMQILVNMIYNSIKHTTDGFIFVKSIEEQKNIKIYVKDTGDSLSLLEIKLLDNVDLDHDLMTNLELPIAKELAILLGGNLNVEHTDFSGTLVCFTLPI